MKSFSTYFIVDYFTDFELNWMVLLIPGVSWSSWLTSKLSSSILTQVWAAARRICMFTECNLRIAFTVVLSNTLQFCRSHPRRCRIGFIDLWRQFAFTLYLIVVNRIFWLVLLWNSDLTVTMPYVRGTEKLEVQLEQANLASFAYPGRSKCYVTYNKWGLGDEVPNMVCYTLAPV